MSRLLKSLFPFALLALILAALVALPGEAQQNKKQAPARQRIQGLKPMVTRAVRTAETKALRDLPAAPAVDAAALGELKAREINEQNAKGLDRVRSPWAPSKPVDAAIRGTRGTVAPLGSSVTPPAIGSFEGLADTDNNVAGLGLVNPPDVNADVGMTQIVETVNSVFRVFDKSGMPLTPVLKQSTLFAPLGGQCAAGDPGDPIVLYDRIADRWQISQFNFSSTTTPPYHQCVAISKTGDAAGEYYVYDFITPGNDFPDYPKLGVWSDGYYMSTRQFTFGGPFNGLGAFAFNRAKMLAGDPTAELIFFAIPFDASYPSGTSSGIQPSDHDGLLPPPPGAPNVFAIYDSDEFGVADEVHLFDFHADFATPANSTFTERAESPISVPAFNDDEPSGRADIEEPAPGENLDSIPDRLMHRLSYRNLNGVESLVTNHTVNVSGEDVGSAATYQAASRYYEFRKSTPGGPYTVYDAATYAPDPGNGATGTNRWMGSTAIDGQGNLAMGYSASSTTLFPSIRYVGRAFDQLGGSLSNEVTLFAGLGTQSASGNRWGDYTSMSVDPADDCTFWYANEYYPTGNTGFNWHTRIGNFIFPTCTPPAQGTLTGTITACDSGATIGEALVTVTGGPSDGFSTSTADDGTFAMQLAPGTYNVTVTSGIRNCVASESMTVVITDGQTTNFALCLDGTPKVTLPEHNPNPVTIVGDKGPGQIIRNDCDLLFVEVQNAGCAIASGVVGTLSTTTPGVMVTQPSSPYSDLAIDDTAANDMPFQVSTSPAFACGTIINFTLTMTYDGGGSDVLTFSIPTCQAAPQGFSGTVQAGDPVTVDGRLGRNGVAASCAGKACPGPFGSGPRAYDTFSFVNGGGVPACATVNLSSACGTTLLASAYLNSFDPSNLCTNYLGDAGASSSAQQFSVMVPGGATVVVVVMEASAGTTCAYTGTVSGLLANLSGEGVCPASLTTRVNNANIILGAETFDIATLSGAFEPVGGTITFRLFGPNDTDCSGTPIFTSIQAVDGGNGEYSSTPFTPTATGVYRWVASYSGDNVNPPVSGECNDPNETVTVGPVPTPTPTPSPSPTPAPAQALNLSTRMRVLTDAGVGIGGFIISDSGLEGSGSKRVLIRAIGPSLSRFGLVGFLLDPTLELHGPGGFTTIVNDDWQDTDPATIAATGLPPIHNKESAIVATLAPGAYTAIIAGKNRTTGIGLVEVYDLNPSGSVESIATSELANISTRAFVDSGSNLMIAGFILGNSSANRTVIVRGLGPSLAAAGVPNTLADPSLEVRNGEGTLLASNNSWQDVPAQAMQISAAGLAPTNPTEAAIAGSFGPGAYTVLLTDQNNGVGNGLIEVYLIQPAAPAQQ